MKLVADSQEVEEIRNIAKPKPVSLAGLALTSLYHKPHAASRMPLTVLSLSPLITYPVIQPPDIIGYNWILCG